MNAGETTAVLFLWTALGITGALVLVAYRILDRAYRSVPDGRSAALPPGTEAPDIEWVAPNGVERYVFPAVRLSLLAFVADSCPKCQRLIDALRAEVPESIPVAVFHSASTEPLDLDTNDRVAHFGLNHPADVVRDFGVSTVPFLFALDGRRILVGRAVSSASSLRALLSEVSGVQSRSRHEHEESPLTSVDSG